MKKIILLFLILLLSSCDKMKDIFMTKPEKVYDIPEGYAIMYTDVYVKKGGYITYKSGNKTVNGDYHDLVVIQDTVKLGDHISLLIYNDYSNNTLAYTIRIITQKRVLYHDSTRGSFIGTSFNITQSYVN